MPKNLRRQATAIFVWYLQERADLNMIHGENNVLIDNELVIVKDFFRTLKHACLYIQIEHPCQVKVLSQVLCNNF